MALTPQDYEFLADILRDATQYDRYDNTVDSRVTCKTLRRHLGEKILHHAKSRNSGFNEDKFRELANLPRA